MAGWSVVRDAKLFEAPRTGAELLKGRLLAFSPCRLAMVTRGDVIRFLRPWMVDVEDVGEATWDARDSTSSIGRDCQPLLTLTIAYDKRVRSSAVSYVLIISLCNIKPQMATVL